MRCDHTTRNICVIIWMTALIHTVVCASRGYRRVCYYANWATKRPTPEGRVQISDLDPTLCTHMIYAFAIIDPLTLTIAPSEPDDITRSKNGQWVKGRYREFTDLKQTNPDLVTMLSLGGARQPSYLFEQAIENENNRWVLINSIMETIRQYEFDGLDVDWEYPGMPAKGSSVESREYFTKFLQELRDVFDVESSRTDIRVRGQRQSRSLVLSVAVGVGEDIIQQAYQIHHIAGAVDFMNVMTYDFHGGWDRFTGGNSPLLPRTHDPRYNQALCVTWAIKEYIRRGVPPWKLNLGIASQGRTFTLKNVSDAHTGSPATGHGLPGALTQQQGTLAYPEVCDVLNKGGTVEYDDVQKFPYVHLEDQWVSYENVDSIKEKVEFVLRRRLGGVMLWSLDLDDVTGSWCNTGPFPVANTIKSYLRGRRVTDNKARWHARFGGSGAMVTHSGARRLVFFCTTAAAVSVLSTQAFG